MPVQLNKEFSIELMNFLGSSSLEDYINIISPPTRCRPLYGKSSLITRTIGEGFSGPDSFTPTYYDSYKEAESETEFAEFIEAVKNYDANPIKDNLVHLVLEVGDLLFQRSVLDARHKTNPKYQEAVELIDIAINYSKQELERRNISLNLVTRLMNVKYGTRSWLNIRGFPTKNKELEQRLCIEELERIDL